MSKKNNRVQIDVNGVIHLDGSVVKVENMRLQDGSNRELTPKEAVLVAKAIRNRHGPPTLKEQTRILCQDVKRVLTLSELNTPIAFQFMCIMGAGISSLGGMLAVLPFIGHYVNVTAVLEDLGAEPIFSPVDVIEFGFAAWVLGLLMQFWAKASDSAQTAKKAKGEGLAKEDT